MFTKDVKNFPRLSVEDSFRLLDGRRDDILALVAVDDGNAYSDMGSYVALVAKKANVVLDFLSAVEYYAQANEKIENYSFQEVKRIGVEATRTFAWETLASAVTESEEYDDIFKVSCFAVLYAALAPITPVVLDLPTVYEVLSQQRSAIEKAKEEG